MDSDFMQNYGRCYVTEKRPLYTHDQFYKSIENDNEDYSQ